MTVKDSLRQSGPTASDAGKVVMDYPTAWAFIRDTDPADHHERCSWRETGGGFLCDCDVLWDEYERRGGTRPNATPPANGVV